MLNTNFKAIGQLALQKKILRCFTMYGHGSHLSLVWEIAVAGSVFDGIFL